MDLTKSFYPVLYKCCTNAEGTDYLFSVSIFFDVPVALKWKVI